MLSNIHIEDYDYPLPESRIARHPLDQRDASKLLFDNSLEISIQQFRNIPSLIPSNSALVFNDTRVFHARLLFLKPSGALIEIFCLEPMGMDFQETFSSLGPVHWQCMIGNAKRWKSGSLVLSIRIREKDVLLQATLLAMEKGLAHIRFSWNAEGLSFGELIDAAGAIPIPPYLKRQAEENDKQRYQTLYARIEGSVAAPTAGLHFTDVVINELRSRGVETGFVTLHVGAGTFKPVVSERIDEHEMHPEHFIVSRQTIEWLISMLSDRLIIAVGTTSVRTLESLYWLGVDSREILATEVAQWRPYLHDSQMSAVDALRQLLSQMQKAKLSHLEGITRIMIRPGYQFRVINGLITNFHQPRSTLLLLVAALMG
jgi:S-adenosylmethionine:tRNA ribosyltransferase-isomerase